MIERPADFLAALAHMGFSQSSFARFLKDMGDDRTELTISRSIQRMVSGDHRISGEMRALIGVLQRVGGVQGVITPRLKRSPAARRAIRAARTGEKVVA